LKIVAILWTVFDIYWRQRWTRQKCLKLLTKMSKTLDKNVYVVAFIMTQFDVTFFKKR
jgi:hypothetical protein